MRGGAALCKSLARFVVVGVKIVYMDNKLREDVGLLISVAESAGFVVSTGYEIESEILNDGLHWDRCSPV